MVLRGMGLGFVLWLINAALFRFSGQLFFTPSLASHLLLFASTAVVGATISFALVKLSRGTRADACEAAVSIAFPSLLLNALLVYDFVALFPNLDGAMDGVYGAMALIYAAAIVFTGLMMTQLSARDERIWDSAQ